MKSKLLVLFLLLLSKGVQAQLSDAQRVDSLIQISRSLTGQSDFEKALDLNAQAEKIALDKCSRLSAAHGSVCFNHGRILTFKGDFSEAEYWYKESIAIREKILGKEHPDYAKSLSNLGLNYYYLGDYEKVEPLYLEVKSIREKALGKEHPDYAQILNNLAVLYDVMGDYKKAEPLYLEAKDIREKTLGKEHPDYAESLYNLGILYQSMGNYTKAEPFQLEDLAITEKTLGKEHPSYAKSLTTLALLYTRMGNYQKAEPLFLQALAIQENTLGKEHFDYAISLNNLADLYAKMGDFPKAESYYLEARTVFEKALGKEHPHYVTNLNDLALFYAKAQRNQNAAQYFIEVSRLDRLLIARAATYSAENAMLNYLKSFEDKIAELLSFTQLHPTPELCQESYNNALFFNGLVLENSRLMARAIAHADSLSRSVFDKWQNCHRRLAKRYARPIEERKKIAEVETEAEGYEKMLMRSLPTFREARKIPTWEEVRDHLKAGEAALEFIHYSFFTPDKTDRIQYVALLLRPGWEAPKMIPLFEEKTLDSLLNTHGERKADYVAHLYSNADRGIVATEKSQKSLYELIFKPLEKELNGVHTLFFAPTGLLHRLNLAAIPLNPDTTLADRYRLIELGSTRSLAADTKAGQFIAQTETPFNNLDALLFGGVQFEMDSTAIFAANARLQESDLASRGAAEETSTDATARGGSWNYLKWTEKEVNAIAPILTSNGLTPTLRKGFEATEEAFKSIGTTGSSPRILHLATHGFFFPDPGNLTHSNDSLYARETGFKTSNNPLIRSGLLLAGANYAWKTGKPLKKGMENGILTAYEISHMNLSNTELVVLSACETGLGDIQGNEGVYGLQRAFKIAGAKYLIMSLWQVPDFQTQELMTTFYTHWLTEKMSLPEAFHTAQQDMREKYQNPYFWAGFVLME